MKKPKTIFLVIFILIAISLFFVFQNQKAEAPIKIKKENVSADLPVRDSTSLDQNNLKRANLEMPEERVVIEKKETSAEVKLPLKVFVSVPFTTQAPFSKWDEYHEEACEEASLLMVQYFLQKKKLTKEIAESEIQKMIAFQIKNYGDYMDSTAQEIVKLASDFYGIKNLKVIYDFSKEDLKKELAKGNPVIVPAAGRLLGNPNFTAPGPLYHALVLKGYDGDTIITNDPGTRKGEGYRYDINTLYNAIHDFTGDKNKIEMGKKAMIAIQDNN